MRSRTLFAAVTLGGAGALLLAGIELGFLLGSAFGYFDGPAELARFAGCQLFLLLGAGVLVGLVEGGLASAIDALPQHRRSLAYTVLCAPPVAFVCAQIFRGPRASQLPGHHVYAVLIGLGALAALYGGLQLLARFWRDSDGSAGRFDLLLVALSLSATIGLYLADQRILPRLYPFFHVGVGLLAYAAAQLTCALGWLYLRRVRAPLAASLAGGRAMALVLIVGLVGGGLSLAGLRASRGLRTLALERTAPLSRLLRVAQRVLPAASTNAAVVAAAPAATAAPLPDGPHLGGVDVFLITVDAMRADKLNEHTAPNLSALAQHGTVFERAYAQVPHTSFSVATLLTGKHVYALSALGLDAAHHETLAQVLRRERYKTACFFPPSAFYIDHDRLRAFEQSAYDFEYVKYEYLPAPARTDQIIRYLEDEKPAHTFVWAHYLEPHEPYELHPGHTAPHPTLGDRYDGEVHYADAEIGRLLAYLRQHRPNGLIVIAADHGEEFGEHGGHYHGTTLYDEQVRVPLVFATLDGAPPLPVRRVPGPVGLVDVAPTLLGLIGIQPSAKMRGRDLGPWLSASGAPDAALGPTFAEIDRKKMIVEGGDKLICDLEADACQLYDLAKDPHEQHNLPDSPRYATLEAHLKSWMAEESRYERGLVPAPDDAQARRALERGRLGERGAAKELAAQLDSKDLATRREAARLLATIAPDPQVSAQLATAARAGDEELRRWAEIGLTRLGDAAARQSLAGWLPPVCAQARSAPQLCAHGALALGDAALLGQALDGARDDQELAVALIRALGATHDPRALDPLLVRLGEVRTRLEVTLALGTLGDARALPTLARWVAAEPYIPVRAAMVRVIATLAQHAPGKDQDAQAALTKLAAVEREPLVMRALVDALATLGAPGVLPLRGLRVPTAGGELWLAGEGSGTVEVTQNGAAVRVPFSGGVAVVAARPGPLSLRVVDGAATVARAFWRPAPPSG